MALTGRPDPNVLLAFDFGLRRIGIATGNLLTRTASPLTTLGVGTRIPWDSVDGVVEEWNPGWLVVGQPGPEPAKGISASAAAFAARLAKRYRLPVSRVDESLTSRAAQALLREQRSAGIMTRRVRKEDVDSQAACLLAEQWMNSAHCEPDRRDSAARRRRS